MAAPDHNEGSGGFAPTEPSSDAPNLGGRVRGGWAAWRRWRRSRPFWGGLLVVLGGAEILLSEKAPLPLVVHIGLQGLAGYLIPAVMVLCGLLLLFNPAQKTFYSILAILLALGSWITSNLGGFFVGMLLGVVGGALAFAWQRRDQAEPEKGRHRQGPRRPDEPSEGLGLILGDSPADSGAADKPPTEPGMIGAQPESERPRSIEPPDSGKRPPGDDSGEPGTGPVTWGVTAIMVVPLALAALVIPMIGGPGPGAGAGRAPALAAGPEATPSPCTSLPLRSSGKPSPNRSTPSSSPSQSAPPTPDRSPSPSPCPSATPSPAPSATPSPTPSRRHTRHVAVGGPPAARAADEQFTLTAGTAVLGGLSFAGTARVPTAAGVVPMLKLSMDSLTLSGGPLFLVEGDGLNLRDRGTFLAFRGHVVLYATRISGELHGTRVTFVPKRPPSLGTPGMTLVNVVAYQPYTIADSLQASGIAEGPSG